MKEACCWIDLEISKKPSGSEALTVIPFVRDIDAIAHAAFSL